jgi:competence protein ComEA
MRNEWSSCGALHPVAARRNGSPVTAASPGSILERRVRNLALDGRCRALTIALVLVGHAGLAYAASPANAPPAGPTPAATKDAAPIDINSASRAQLKTLPGIGDVEADRIVSGRPYRSKADLAERDVIPIGVFLSLKDRVIAIQPNVSKARAR